MPEKFDALRHRRCKSCAAWHNPEGQDVGSCVLYPGQAFLVGVMPGPGALLRNPGAPPAPQAALQSEPIPKRGDDGCLQWRSRETMH